MATANSLHEGPFILAEFLNEEQLEANYLLWLGASMVGLLSPRQQARFEELVTERNLRFGIPEPAPTPTIFDIIDQFRDGNGA